MERRGASERRRGVAATVGGVGGPGDLALDAAVARVPAVHCCETRRTFPVGRFPARRREGAPSGERRRLRASGGAPAGGLRRRDRTVTMRQGATKHRRYVSRCRQGVTDGGRMAARRQATAESAGRSRAARRPASVAATSSRTPRWTRQGQVPDAAHQHVAGRRGRGGRTGPRLVGQHHLVQVAVDRGDPRAAGRGGLGQLLEHRRPGAQLADQRRGRRGAPRPSRSAASRG